MGSDSDRLLQDLCVCVSKEHQLLLLSQAPNHTLRTKALGSPSSVVFPELLPWNLSSHQWKACSVSKEVIFFLAAPCDMWDPCSLTRH